MVAQDKELAYILFEKNSLFDSSIYYIMFIVFQFLVVINLLFYRFLGEYSIRFSSNEHHNKNLLLFRLFVVIASGITLLQIVLYVYFSGFAGGGGGGDGGDNILLNGVAIILLNSFFIQWFTFFVVIPLGYSLLIQPFEGNIGSFLANYVVYDDYDMDEEEPDTTESAAAAAASSAENQNTMEDATDINSYFGSMHTIKDETTPLATTRHRKALLKYLIGQFPVVFFASMISIITSLRGSTVYLI